MPRGRSRLSGRGNRTSTALWSKRSASAIDAWDTRVAAATSLAAAARRLLPYTGGQQQALADRLDEAERDLPLRPAPPLDSPEAIDAAMEAFGRVAALEEATRAVLAAAAAAEGPLSLVAASADLESGGARDAALYRRAAAGPG